MFTRMKEKYFPQEIEQKWQRRWAEEKTFEVKEEPGREKFYCLEMLAYTSGRAHIGHVSNFTIGDALAWYKRARLNVIHPFGGCLASPPKPLHQRITDPEKLSATQFAYMKWRSSAWPEL